MSKRSGGQRRNWRLFAEIVLTALTALTALGGFGFQPLQSTELPGEVDTRVGSTVDDSFIANTDGAVNAISLISITRNGADIVVTFEAVQGTTYRLQRKLNITDSPWQSIAGVSDLTAANNGPAQITDPGAINLGNAFYRVSVPTTLGGFCSTQPECATGLTCVDNVCCNSACNGGCERCDVSGSVGTCSPVANGQDPDQECGAVSCTAYYYGWEGDICYRKADASAAQASCNGAHACHTVAEECSAQSTRGALYLTCDSFCQDPTSNTCTGTTAGTCTNLNQGNETCGVGPCQTTVPRCVNGAPNTCVPNSGAATIETCNGIDDNCDGTIDNGSFSDAGEPNNDCTTYRSLPQVGSDQTGTQNTLTLYPSGDADYFRIPAVETDQTCGCGTFATDEDYQLKVTLTVPAGAGSYTFCTDAACGTVGNFCQTVNAGTSATWIYNLDGACNVNDSYSIYVRVAASSAPGFQCVPYTLSYFFDAGLCVP